MLALASLPLHAPPAVAAQAWIVRSDQISKPLLDDMCSHEPEFASMWGQEQFDTELMDLKPKLYERKIAEFEKELQGLVARRGQESDSRVRQDIDIMVEAVTRKMARLKLDHHYLIAYGSVPMGVFYGMQTLLDARNKPARQAKALIRLKRYAGRETGFTPLTLLARARLEEELARPGLIGPYAEEIKQDIANSVHFLDGIPKMMKEAKLTGWEDDLDALREQVAQYNQWLEKHLLPRARVEVRLPAPLYAAALRDQGVDITTNNHR